MYVFLPNETYHMLGYFHGLNIVFDKKKNQHADTKNKGEVSLIDC